MSTPLERALARTLSAKADDAPPPVHGLAATAARKARARLRNRVGAAAAVTVLLAGGVGWGVLNPTDLDKTGPTVSAGDGQPLPVEKLWPEAARHVKAVPPQGLADADWQIVSVLDGSRLLIFWNARPSGPAKYAVYEPQTGRTVEIVGAGWGPAQPEFAVGSESSGERLVWHAMTEKGVEIVVADPTGEDSSRLVLTDGGHDGGGYRAGITGDRLYWDSSEGVFTAPLNAKDDRARVAPKGFRIVEWPWIAEFDDGKPGVFFEDIRNVETGETRAAKIPSGDGPWFCGVVWCSGRDSLARRDGSVTIPNPMFLGPRPPKDAPDPGNPSAPPTRPADPSAAPTQPDDPSAPPTRPDDPADPVDPPARPDDPAEAEAGNSGPADRARPQAGNPDPSDPPTLPADSQRGNPEPADSPARPAESGSPEPAAGNPGGGPAAEPPAGDGPAPEPRDEPPAGRDEPAPSGASEGDVPAPDPDGSPEPQPTPTVLGGPNYNRYTEWQPPLDRFLFQGSDASGRVTIRDLETGKTGYLAAKPGELVHGREGGRANRYVVLPTGDGYLFLDLAAVR
ncbi:hypothetical protein [Actinocorallia sp. A-T 12471]|uniref:hypothetical protein n=1 Tax=Actinocorallia sp. A-T 12471 TaxID=3089813 RepID=UPI0029D115C6|nr:hypothetical protein [Actinocorallia sp. A-T 12471]MDX6738483.1 hypothetical protein [Actinocorallia sp. A-T 12471]